MLPILFPISLDTPAEMPRFNIPPPDYTLEAASFKELLAETAWLERPSKDAQGTPAKPAHNEGQPQFGLVAAPVEDAMVPTPPLEYG